MTGKLKTAGKKVLQMGKRMLDVLGKMRLVTVYAWVFLISMIIWMVSFYLTNHIARNSIQSEYTEYNEELFEQTISDIDRGIRALVQLSYTVMSNSSINSFLLAESFTERSDSLEEVNAEFNRLRTIESSISSINLYNIEGWRLASSGVSAPEHIVDITEKGTSIVFSGPYTVEQSRYFGIQIPLFSMKDSRVTEQNGYCLLLIHMSYLEESIPDMLLSGDQWFVLYDDDEDILLEAGKWPEILQNGGGLSGAELDELQRHLVYRGNFYKAGWHIVFGVSETSMFRGINRLQMINLISDMISGLLILLLLVGIYASFLRPVHQQIRFMNYYAVDRRSRMEVRSHNEMGRLAENLNAMLDDIDRLNDENIQARKRALEAEYQKKQSELLAYRSQINPHFLYNTFECIRGMALYYEVPDIAAISESLAGFFTYNIRGKGYARIREVRDHILEYASIIGYRFHNRYRIDCAVEEDVMDCMFPKMVIQPLIENAIFHGLEKTEEDGSIQIRIERFGGNLRILISDNGHGMEKETLEKLRERLREYDRTNLLPVEKHGIGMVNIYRRLRLFYGQELGFFIESQPGVGTKIQILVPSEIHLTEDDYVPGFFD